MIYIGSNIIPSVKVGSSHVVNIYVGSQSVMSSDFDYNMVNHQVGEYLTNTEYPSNDYSYTDIPQYVVQTDYRKDQPKTVDIYVGSAIKLELSDDNFVTHIDFTPTSSIVTICNIIPNAYQWRTVGSNDEILQSGELEVIGDLRMIKADSLYNVRDIGGWACIGGHIAYGKVIRGSEFDRYLSSTGTMQQVISVTDIANLKNIVGVNAELDLRADDAHSSSSVLGDDVTYIHQAIGGYPNGGNSQYRKSFRRILECLRANKTVYVHCQGGADRTGSLIFMLNALMGVSESDLCKDYELTSFSSYGLRCRNFDGTVTSENPNGYNFLRMVNYVKSLEGSTFAEKVEKFWKVSNATEPPITDNEILEMKGYLIV